MKSNHSELNLSKPAFRKGKKDFTNFLQYDFMQKKDSEPLIGQAKSK